MRSRKTLPYDHIESVSVHSETRKIQISILVIRGVIRTQDRFTQKITDELARITTIPQEKITQGRCLGWTTKEGFETWIMQGLYLLIIIEEIGISQITEEDFIIGIWIIQHRNRLIITEGQNLLHLLKTVECGCENHRKRNNFKTIQWLRIQFVITLNGKEKIFVSFRIIHEVSMMEIN